MLENKVDINNGARTINYSRNIRLEDVRDAGIKKVERFYGWMDGCLDGWTDDIDECFKGS